RRCRRCKRRRRISGPPPRRRRRISPSQNPEQFQSSNIFFVQRTIFSCVAPWRMLHIRHGVLRLPGRDRQFAKAREDAMTDTTMKPKPAKAAAPVIPLFEMPKFDIPSFDMPKVEIPAAFREYAEKGVAQTKDAYEKFKAVAEENSEMLETVYTTASKGASDYG